VQQALLQLVGHVLEAIEDVGFDAGLAQNALADLEHLC
jgi:hypothetical protein